MSHQGPCRACGRLLVTTTTWYLMSAEQRLSGKYRRQRKGDLCMACRVREVRAKERAGRPQPPRGPTFCKVCGVETMTKKQREARPEMPQKQGDYCRSCYCKAYRAGTLESTEQRPADEVLDEWEMLRDTGTTDMREAARRMGMSFAALEKACLRARRKGDPRGSRVPYGHDVRRTA